jgi:hypothetical protein
MPSGRIRGTRGQPEVQWLQGEPRASKAGLKTGVFECFTWVLRGKGRWEPLYGKKILLKVLSIERASANL